MIDRDDMKRMIPHWGDSLREVIAVFEGAHFSTRLIFSILNEKLDEVIEPYRSTVTELMDKERPDIAMALGKR